MTKIKLTVFLIYFTASAIMASEIPAIGNGEGEWRRYFQETNGNVYFFHISHVKTVNNIHEVWNRIRYKRSVMGASSYQSLLEIDCSARTQRILQNTFFSDKNWEKPAMNTNMTKKPRRIISEGSASERLSKILCVQ